MNKIDLEKKLHIVSVYECEVAGYIENGWKLVEPKSEPKPKSKRKPKSKEVKKNAN